MVETEVMMHAVSYNLVRSLMQEAAIRHQIDLTRISFKDTVDALRHWSASLEALRGRSRNHAQVAWRGGNQWERPRERRLFRSRAWKKTAMKKEIRRRMRERRNPSMTVIR